MTSRRDTNDRRPVAITVAVASVLALAVAAGGALLAKRSERIRLPEPGNRQEAQYREVTLAIDRLEHRWEEALARHAQGLLHAASPIDGSLPEVEGVVQSSYLSARLFDPTRAHHRPDGQAPSIRPVLETYAKREAGEWVLPDAATESASGFREEPGRPLAYVAGNGSAAVVLLLDRAPAEAVAIREITGTLPAGDGQGFLEWIGPDGAVLGRPGNSPPADTPPDELFRHLSRFGDWTLRRWYPVTVKTVWRTPVLAGSFALAGLVLAGGVAVAAAQRKSIRLAGEQVSFVNHVSHELRTPLTNLLLNADLALDGLSPADGKLRRRLGLIREETARLSRIVDNVLAFARLDRGAHDDRRAACDLDRVLEEARENFAPLFERKGIRCEFTGQAGGPVELDRDAFAQIVSNLLSNVEKYAGEGAKVRVALERTPDRCVLEVEDDGPGIPKEARARVFLPFERAVSRTDEGASGTGLGLAISRSLAEGMGGRLDLLESGRGSRFRMEIPLGERRRG